LLAENYQIDMGFGTPKNIINRMPYLIRFFIASMLLFALEIRPCMTETMESQIKTAYVLNFVKFTQWPAETGAEGKVRLCVLGNKVLDESLVTLEGRKAGRFEINVVKYSTEAIAAMHMDAPRVLGKCQVVFIGESERHRYIPIIKSLANAPVLTISDIDDFAENGGGIGLRYRDNKIIFEVNLESVQRSKLHLPAQLLNLASYIFTR